MSAASTERRARTVHLRCIREDDVLEPTKAAHEARSDSPPDLERDYRPIAVSELIALDLRRTRVVVEHSYHCDLRCKFCDLPVEDRTSIDITRWRSVLQLLALGGARHLTLTGGEPGIHRGVREFVRDASTWGFHVAMLSHGAWAANRQYLAQLLAAGLREVDVSLKATDRDVFRRITGRDRALRQRAGIIALGEAHAAGTLSSFRVNHVLTASTLPALADLAWLGTLPAPPVVTITLCEPYRVDMLAEVPTGASLRQHLTPALDALQRAGLSVRLEGVPWCYVAGRSELSRDAQRSSDHDPRVTISPRGDGDYLMVHFGYQRHLQFRHTQACVACAHVGACPGVHKKLVDIMPPQPSQQ